MLNNSVVCTEIQWSIVYSFFFNIEKHCTIQYWYFLLWLLSLNLFFYVKKLIWRFSWISDDGNQLCLTGGAYNYDGSQAAVVTCKAELNISSKAQFLRPNEEEKCCEASSITTSHSFMHPLLLMIAGHLGRDVAIKLLQQGAAQILHEAKKVNEKKIDNTI